MLAAQLMRFSPEKAGQPTRIVTAFIHHVQPTPIDSEDLGMWPGSGKVANKRILATQQIYLFRQYGEAACEAFQHGHISADGYHRVMESIMKECGFTSRPVLQAGNTTRTWNSKECRILMQARRGLQLRATLMAHLCVMNEGCTHPQ